MRYFFLLLMIFNGSKIYSQGSNFIFKGGTCILCFISKDSILIAADSRQTNTYDVDIIAPATHHLKIRTHNNIYYTFAGNFTTIFNPKSEKVFDAYDLMEKTIDKYNNIDSVFMNLNKVVLKVIDSIYKLMPYKVSYSNKKELDNLQMDVSIFTYKKNTPKYRFAQFGFTENGKDTVFKFIETTSYNKMPFIHYMGIASEAMGYIDNQKISDKTDFKKLLMAAIKIEIKIYPTKVGLPIDVLSISPKGYRWLTNNKYY